MHQMLVNYQMKHEGGDGFLRLVRFLPDDETIHVTAYSPSLDAVQDGSRQPIHPQVQDAICLMLRRQGAVDRTPTGRQWRARTGGGRLPPNHAGFR